MQKKSFLVLSVAAVLLTACSGKLGELSSDNFTVTPNPLESQAGKVEATINGMFPEFYMKKKAEVTVTPQLRFAGQAVNGQSAYFQGEKVLGNNQTISYKAGGRYAMKTVFDYVPDMEQSELYLTFDAKVGGKSVNVPDVKVADGVIATSELYKRTLTSTQPARATDAFERVLGQKQEANIQFLIAQANLRRSELQNNSVKEFVRLLGDIVQNQQTLDLQNVEVAAFASPDGGYDLNDRLASQRQDAAAKYVQEQMKKAGVNGALDTKYTAEDWEGFQQLVAASNIQDKDVILRVLSMYKDPEEREQQIRNISSAFRELADGILPQLRRARLTINYNVLGRSNEEIKQQLSTNAVNELSVEEMLYGAKLYGDDINAAENAYKKATEAYPNDARAFNNVAMAEFAKGNYAEAQKWLEKANRIKSLPETNANLGLIALQQGDVAKAEQYISKATGANGLNEVLGNLHLAQGKYAQAQQDFGALKTNSAALAQILNKDYALAAGTLRGIQNGDATTDYLTAILNARQGNNSAAAKALKAAIAKDPTYAAYAAKDLELVNVAK